MNSDDLDISGLLTWDDNLPHPKWDLVEAWVESHGDGNDPAAAWVTLGRAWLIKLAKALGGAYSFGESEHFQIVLPGSTEEGGALAGLAERCRALLLSGLGDLVKFQAPGKEIAIVMGNTQDYYRYIARFYDDGKHPASGGVHVRNGYAHIVVLSIASHRPEHTLTHELAHAALRHRQMPLWLEEGLAEVFAHDATGRPLLVDARMAGEHHEYWGRNGLEGFWRGDTFYAADEGQTLSYELAEILVRLLAEDGRPRWFGLVREPQRRFFAFLQSASDTDCGAAACRRHLGFDLAALAGRFLGSGD